MKSKLRKIQIDGETYLWKRNHHHLTEFEHSKCVEKVTIYLEGFKKSPLQLSFREEDNLILKTDIEKEKWCVGYPDEGIIWLFQPRSDKQPQTNTIDINLNRPAVIAGFIQYFKSNGCNPKEIATPFIEENALTLLDTIDLPHGRD